MNQVKKPLSGCAFASIITLTCALISVIIAYIITGGLASFIFIAILFFIASLTTGIIGSVEARPTGRKSGLPISIVSIVISGTALLFFLAALVSSIR